MFPLAGKRSAIPSCHPDGDPLKGICKGECGKLGHGLYDATIDPVQIVQWWPVPDINPRGIGIRTGAVSGIYVLDFDGDEGYSTFEELYDVTGELPPTKLCATANGLHLYFTIPPDLPSALPTMHYKDGKPALPGWDHVDFQGEDAYVVAPPSAHISGPNYRWDATFPEDPVPLPDPISWLILERKRGTSAAPSSASSAPARDIHLSAGLDMHEFDHLGPETTSKYGESILKRVFEEISSMGRNSGRNNALNEAGVKIGHWIGDQILFSDAVQTLVWAAQACGEWQDDEAKSTSTIKRSLEVGMREPHVKDSTAGGALTATEHAVATLFLGRAPAAPSTPPSASATEPVRPWERPLPEQPEQPPTTPAPGPEPAHGQAPTADHPAAPRVGYEPIELISATKIMNEPDPVWLIDGWLPETGTCQIMGASGSGKTFQAIHMAGCITNGLSWYGENVNTPGSVVLVAQEGTGGLGRRCKAWVNANHHDLDNFRIVRRKRPISLNISRPDGEADVAELIDKLSELSDLRLVLFDTQILSMPGLDENDNGDVGLVFSTLGVISKSVRCLVGTVHHSGRDASHERGATAGYAAVETQIKVTKQKIELTKQRDGETGLYRAYALTPDLVSGSVFVYPLSDEVAANNAVEEERDQIARINERILKIVHAHNETGIKKSDLITALGGGGSSYTSNKEAIAAAVTAGIIVEFRPGTTGNPQLFRIPG